MRGSKLWVPVLGALACGATLSPDFRSKYGSNFFLNGQTDAGFSAQVCTDMETDLMARLAARGWNVDAMKRAVSEAEVFLKPGPFACTVYSDTPGVKPRAATCAGIEDRNILSVANEHDGCPWTSAYRHELFHWLQSYVQGKDDLDHAAPEWKEIINDPVYKCHGINTP